MFAGKMVDTKQPDALAPLPVSAETLAAVMKWNMQARPPVVVSAEMLAEVMNAQIAERERGNK